MKNLMSCRKGRLNTFFLEGIPYISGLTQCKIGSY